MTVDERVAVMRLHHIAVSVKVPGTDGTLTEDRSDDAVSRLRLALVIEGLKEAGQHDFSNLGLAGNKLEYIADLVS